MEIKIIFKQFGYSFCFGHDGASFSQSDWFTLCKEEFDSETREVIYAWFIWGFGR